MADDMTRDRISDEAALERDVRRTQDEIGETVQKLEEKMNPREIAREVMGDEGTDVAREALEVTRQNPIPVAMIAVGLIWILATSRSPMIARITDRITGRKSRGMNLRPRSAEPAPIGPSPGGESDRGADRLRPRSAEPAPIGPSSRGDAWDRRPAPSVGPL
ncbi:MAG: DUF3618 domain-containing protein [Allosphingosinicella sp.]